MSLIKVSDLTFGYDGSYDLVFDHASFQLDTNWRLGFTGRNGRGKTTFLRLLLGQYEYSGTISASVGFDYFPYDVPDQSRPTTQVLEAVCPAAMAWEIQRELGLLGVEEDVLERPFSTLSSGEQTKTLLAALFLNENRFLLIDEPTNHLDEQARGAVADYLRRKRGFILVSHDRAFLDGCVDHILSINKADIEVCAGNFSTWMQNKADRDAMEQARNQQLRGEIGRLQQAARRTGDWSDRVEQTKFQRTTAGLRPDRGFVGHKAAKMMQRSKAIEQRREQAVAEKQSLLQNVEEAEPLKLHPLVFHADRLLELREVRLFYGEKQVCGPVTLTVRQGDRVAVTGRNGCGKSTLLRLLRGEDVAHTGTLLQSGQLKISYVSQDTSHLRGSVYDYCEACGVDQVLFLAILRKLDFPRAQFEKDMEDFSGGQKKKVLLARSLCQQAHLYVWDEPLNFIDVLSRVQIQKLILEYRPTLLFVEHDAAFRKAVATDCLCL